MPSVMSSTKQFHMELKLHEETPLSKWPTILYEAQRFHTHAIAREFSNLFLRMLDFFWELDFNVYYNMSSNILLSTNFIIENHTNTYLNVTIIYF